jgi:hypothetical protein
VGACVCARRLPCRRRIVARSSRRTNKSRAPSSLLSIDRSIEVAPTSIAVNGSTIQKAKSLAMKLKCALAFGPKANQEHRFLLSPPPPFPRRPWNTHGFGQPPSASQWLVGSLLPSFETNAAILTFTKSSWRLQSHAPWLSIDPDPPSPTHKYARARTDPSRFWIIHIHIHHTVRSPRVRTTFLSFL